MNGAAYLTTRELAAALQVCQHTILRNAQKGLIPGAVRIGKLWRFPKTILETVPPKESKAMKKLRML